MVPGRSPRLLGLFRGYLRGYAARHFHAVRIARGGPMPSLPGGPLVVVLNHPSWWDPIVGILLSGRFPDRAHFAPIDAKGLERYRFLERLGLFGIEMKTARGARQFLRAGRAILALDDAALWITAQGRFVDPRERPARLQEGVGHLVRDLEAGSVLTLALEYPFWDESRPEALARFGPPIPLGESNLSAADWTDRIARSLESTQDALADDARLRDPNRFETLIEGGAGVGGVYDLWRRARATVRGERFRPEHAPAREPEAEVR